MLVGTASKRPMILAPGFFDRKIVDASEPARHKTVLIEFPVFVAIRAEPVPRVVMPLIGKTHRDPVFFESPEFFDQPVIELLSPLALQEGNDFVPSVHKL